MDIKLNKLYFIICIFSIHLVPFSKNFEFETLPILLLLFIAHNFFFNKINFKKYFYNNQIIILIIIFLFLFYLSNLWEENNKFIELLKYLAGPVVFLFFFKLKKYFRINEIVFFGYGILILFFIFKFKIPIIFGVVCGSMEFFIGRLDCSNTINLNRPFLITPEPSYLSLMLCFYLIILNYFKRSEDYLKKNILVIEILMCFLIYSTSSRVGLMFLFLYLIYKIYILKIYKKLFFTIPLFISILFLLVFSNINVFKNTKNSDDSLINSRNILNIDYILVRFNNNFSTLSKANCSIIDNKVYYSDDTCHIENNLLNIINQSEPTGFVRIIHNYLSLKGSINNKFIGYGLGSYANIWHDHAKSYEVLDIIKTNEVMQKWFPNIENKKQYVQNYFFSVIHDAGIIPAMLISILIIKALTIIIKRKYFFGYVILGYVLVAFFFQSPITSPYPWLALALLYQRKQYV